MEYAQKVFSSAPNFDMILINKKQALKMHLLFFKGVSV